MNHGIDAVIEPLLHSPCLPEIAQALRTRIDDEAVRRQKFYQELRDDQKAEFIDGQVVLHSPARNKDLTVRRHIHQLLDNYVRLHGLGEVRGEKCLCVFPRNDYEPDVVFFGPDKAAAFADGTTKFPVPDMVVEVLSDSTESRDRGVKFEDFEAHGVAEYWIVDADEKVIEQYVRCGDRLELKLKSGSGEIASPTVAGFRIPIRAIFDPDENLATRRRFLTT